FLAPNGTFYTARIPISLQIRTSNVLCVSVNFGAGVSVQATQTFVDVWTVTGPPPSGADGIKTIIVGAFEFANCTGLNVTASAQYILDSTPPTVTATLNPVPNAAGWNNANVTITWSATDAGSGAKTNPLPPS